MDALGLVAAAAGLRQQQQHWTKALPLLLTLLLSSLVGGGLAQSLPTLPPFGLPFRQPPSPPPPAMLYVPRRLPQYALLAFILILMAGLCLLICVLKTKRFCMDRAADPAGGTNGDLHHRLQLQHLQHQAQQQAQPQQPQGLDPAVVQALPLFHYRKAGIPDAVGIKGNDGDCPVCLGEFAEAELVRLLPGCKHLFHRECIDMWLHSHPSCPLCREPVQVQKQTSLKKILTLLRGRSQREQDDPQQQQQQVGVGDEPAAASGGAPPLPQQQQRERALESVTEGAVHAVVVVPLEAYREEEATQWPTTQWRQQAGFQGTRSNSSSRRRNGEEADDRAVVVRVEEDAPGRTSATNPSSSSSSFAAGAPAAGGGAQQDHGGVDDEEHPAVAMLGGKRRRPSEDIRWAAAVPDLLNLATTTPRVVRRSASLGRDLATCTPRPLRLSSDDRRHSFGEVVIQSRRASSFKRDASSLSVSSPVPEAAAVSAVPDAAGSSSAASAPPPPPAPGTAAAAAAVTSSDAMAVPPPSATAVAAAAGGGSRLSFSRSGSSTRWREGAPTAGSG